MRGEKEGKEEGVYGNAILNLEDSTTPHFGFIHTERKVL